MRGAASQELSADGLVARHPSLPLNSVVKVSNPVSGRQIDVTIVGRIDPSATRLIDLSSSAVQQLGIRPGDTVVITVAPQARRAPQERGPQVVQLSEPLRLSQEYNVPPELRADINEQSVSEAIQHALAAQAQANSNQQQPPYNPYSPYPQYPYPQNPYSPYPPPNNYQQNDQKSTPNNQPLEITFVQNADESGSVELLAWLMAMVMDSMEEREARDAIEVREAREAREARQTRETREIRETRETREMREARELREAREARQTRETRELKELHEAREREYAIGSNANNRSNSQEPPARQPDNNLVYTHVLPPRTVEAPPQSNNTQQAVNPVQNVDPPAAPSPAVQPPPVAVRDADPPPVRPAPVKPEDIKIIPGLPDRNSGKTYRLQVASYSASEAAQRAAQFLKAAGFDVEQELSSGHFRVLIKGIAASDVYAASVRLGSLGFGQIWLRD